MNRLNVRTLIALLSVLFVAASFPASAGAYSYGSANTEAVAETFKLTAGKLSASAPDWPAARAAYDEVRAELDAHFGKQITRELDDAFAAKDKDRVLNDWKGVLVLNLKRRFGSAEQQFDKYSDAKQLLAKARATYETLKPYMSGTPAAAKLPRLDQAFDNALEDLGNPGLLGVGKKDPNPEAFKQNVKLIYDTVAPLFPMNGAPAGGVSTEDPTASQGPHAPMKEANKTNPAVTAAAVAIVLAVAGFLLWRRRARK